MKRIVTKTITSAEDKEMKVETAEDRLDVLSDDFDFLVSGIEKLLRDDPESSQADQIISATSGAVSSALSMLAETLE